MRINFIGLKILDVNQDQHLEFNEIAQEMGDDSCFDTLSMGMSSDLEAAIYENTNIVRVGTDIFGPRE